MKKLILLLLLILPVSGFTRYIEITNEFLRAGVDEDTGRFTLHNTEGDSLNATDNNKALLYENTPPTSVTTLSIDDNYQVFGGDNGSFRKRPTTDGKRITTEWNWQDIVVSQQVSFVKGLITGQDDTMQVTYKVQNTGGRKRRIGMRVILDTLLGDIEPRSFGIPGRGNVEKETILYRDSIPAYWTVMDIQDSPNVRAQCTTVGNNATKPDKIIFASWDRLYDNPWDVIIDSTKDYRKKGTGVYDAAAAMFYDPIEVDKGQSLLINIQYGLYGTSIFTAKDMVMSLSVPTEPKSPPVPVSVDFQNTSTKTMDRLDLEIELPRGFALKLGETKTVSFVKIESNATVRALWNLYSGTIGGNFRVKVKASGYVGDKSDSVEAEKTFYMNYIENMGLPAANPEAVKSELPPELKTNTNVIGPEEEEEYEEEEEEETVTNRAVKILSDLSPLQKRLYREVILLDDWISQLNREYEVLMGVYKNGILTNKSYLSDIDRNIRKHEDRLEKARATLTNQNLILRE